MLDRAAPGYRSCSDQPSCTVRERRSLAANKHHHRQTRASIQGTHDGYVTLACECSDPTCRDVISLTVEEVEFIRKVPGRLVVRPGHADPEAERVVMAEPGRFEVVEPFGASA